MTSFFNIAIISNQLAIFNGKLSKMERIEICDLNKWSGDVISATHCQTIDDYEKLLPYKIDKSVLVASVN